VICHGTGERPTLIGVVPCADCGGTGRVHHCVACAGRGNLWLGGSEYIDCPVCPSTRGGIRTPRRFIVMSGRRFEAVPLTVAHG